MNVHKRTLAYTQISKGITYSNHHGLSINERIPPTSE